MALWTGLVREKIDSVWKRLVHLSVSPYNITTFATSISLLKRKYGGFQNSKLQNQ